MKPLTERHRPDTLSAVQGHTMFIKKLRKWAKAWKPGDKGWLLIGDAGIGKTTIAHALANDMDWTLIEVNASDKRRKADLLSLAQQVEARSAKKGGRLLFLDECDSLDGRSIGPLAEALKNPQVPVIAAANDGYRVPGAIKSALEEEKMTLDKRSIKAYLKKVASVEGISRTEAEFASLAERGNLRAALADLDASRGQDIEEDDRWTDVNPFQMVDNVLHGRREFGDMDPEELVIWLDENLSQDLRLLEAGMAYDALSRADVWLGRTRSTGNYRYWKYARELAESTADCRRSKPFDGWIDKSFPKYYRRRTESYDDDSPEAALYRAMKDTEGGRYRFAGDYTRFKATILPLLLDLPEVVRMRLALNHGLGSDELALKGLGLSSADFEDWVAAKDS